MLLTCRSQLNSLSWKAFTETQAVLSSQLIQLMSNSVQRHIHDDAALWVAMWEDQSIAEAMVDVLNLLIEPAVLEGCFPADVGIVRQRHQLSALLCHLTWLRDSIKSATIMVEAAAEESVPATWRTAALLYLERITGAKPGVALVAAMQLAARTVPSSRLGVTLQDPQWLPEQISAAAVETTLRIITATASAPSVAAVFTSDTNPHLLKLALSAASHLFLLDKPPYTMTRGCDLEIHACLTALEKLHLKNPSPLVLGGQQLPILLQTIV